MTKLSHSATFAATETAPVHAPADMIKRLAVSGPSTCATGGSAFRARGIRFRSVARVLDEVRQRGCLTKVNSFPSQGKGAPCGRLRAAVASLFLASCWGPFARRLTDKVDRTPADHRVLLTCLTK